MKTTNHKVQRLLLAVVLLGLGACTGDFEEINRNPNQVTEDQMEALNYKTGTKFKSLQSLVIPVEEHMYQFNESLSGGPFGGYIGATVDSSRPTTPRPTGANGPLQMSSPRPTLPTRASSAVRTTRWPSPSPGCCAWPSCIV